VTAARKGPRLGRGLSALLGEAPAAAPTTAASDAPDGTVRALPIEMLEPSPFQPRGPMEQAPLQELADSIREHGVLQPILVRPKPGGNGRHYEIVGGERRWRAAQLVPLHEIPVVVRDLGDREAMAAALVENLQRQDLNALEEAEGYRRLVEEFALTQDALGQAVGKSRSHVANTMRLLQLPEEVQEHVLAGRLSAGHARAIMTAPDPGALAKRIIDEGLNVRQAEALTKQKPAEGKTSSGSKPRGRNADIAALDFTDDEITLVRTRLDSTHWKRRLPTVAMLSGTAIGEYYLRPVDY
jgi:ParB family chromosome partitioning protein